MICLHDSVSVVVTVHNDDSSLHSLIFCYTEFVHVIVGDETGPEIQDTQSGPRLRRRLIERCDHISDEACRFAF